MASPSVVGVGNALMDRTYELTNLPEPDGGAFVEAYAERPGGVETNVATAAAGLGRDAGVVARLGDDPDGDAVLADLQDGPLDAARVRQVPGDETAYTLVLTAGGERMIVGGGESTLNLRLDAADRAYLADAAVAFTSAYAPAAVVETLADLDGPRVAFDLAGRFRDLAARGFTRDALDDALPDLDLLVGNAAAVRSYLREPDADPRDLAAGLRERGLARAAITLGGDGSLLLDGDRTLAIPAVDVDVVDTTGAGDAHTAGLIHAWLLADEPAERAGRFAAGAAAHACRHRGARSTPPTVAAVEALLD